MKRSTGFVLLLASALAALSFIRSGKALEEEWVDSAGLKISQGFQATVVLDSLGRNRHIATAPNGDVFVKLERLKNQAGIYQLRRDATTGKLAVVTAFGNYTGTGVAVKNGYLFASSDDAVFRYRLDKEGAVVNPAQPEQLVSGLWNRRQHASKSIALDNAGNLYVNIGAPSNACQVNDRTKGSPGQDPCPILDSAGGIWQFRADLPGQGYHNGQRYATGLRNVVGLDWNQEVNELFVMQHGRDQLSQLHPEMYNDEQNAELPAEEFVMATKGSDFGWPYCYYDGLQRKKVLAPEFGGDGKTQGRCAGVGQPLVAFPAHWGPNAVLFYTGNQFPARYRNGAFIAFHGSWNRAPLRQAGYCVAFVPFRNGKPTGSYEIFADGFTQKEYIMSTGEARYRPCGLAQTP
ncbi:MAG: PQQ-dependent sugar dehydrogenase, partial [Chitinophagaceae bacterium]|nr:PQQ-dependent sugar dehydrogenase [Chitinophagaceae bacterium]